MGFYLQTNDPAAPLAGFRWFTSVEQSAFALLRAYGSKATGGKPGETIDAEAREALDQLLWEVFWGTFHPSETRARINRFLLPDGQLIWWGCWEEMCTGAVEMTRWFRGWFRNGGEPALSRHLQRAISDEEEADFVEALRGYDYPLDWSNDQDLEDLRRVW